MITYRLVREWVCDMCGTMNSTLDKDAVEDGVMVCWKCNEEDDKFQLEEENAE